MAGLDHRHKSSVYHGISAPLMLLSPHERRLLGAFLRSHRERLKAEHVGVKTREERRRTPGLRREEVADLCGISPTWYAWIEQGRDISVSASALGRLAVSLRLTGPERAYLFELARARDPARADASQMAEDDPVLALRSALDAIDGPAYLMDPSWCARAWNAKAAMLFADWFSIEGRCLLDYMFLDARARRLVPDWPERARRLAAEFRADMGRRPEDAALQAMIERLRQGSPDFATFWTDHSVLAREGGPRLFQHPTLGPLLYDQITLNPAAWPDYKLVMLVSGS